MKEHIISVDAAACIGCGQCKRDCPVHNIALENKKAVIRSQDCIKCGHCVAICPKAAVSMSGFAEPPVEIQEPMVLDPELLLRAIRARRSMRRFIDRPVPPAVITQIVEAGRFTPTGENAQNVSYIVLQKDRKSYEKLAVRAFRRMLPVARLFRSDARRIAIDDDFFFKKAPAVILVVCRDKVNGALAASNMELMAEACGLGVLYSGFFALAANTSRALRKALGLARGDQVVSALVLGYPGVTYRRTAQKETAAVRYL